MKLEKGIQLHSSFIPQRLLSPFLPPNSAMHSVSSLRENVPSPRSYQKVKSLPLLGNSCQVVEPK